MEVSPSAESGTIPVILDGDLARTGRDAWLVLSLGAGLVTLIVAIRMLFPATFARTVVIPVALFLVIMLFVLTRPWHARQWIRLHASDIAAERLAETVGRLIPRLAGGGAGAGLSELAGQLVRQGHVGVTIQLRSQSDWGAMPRFTVPFEPQVLDESAFPLERDDAGPDAASAPVRVSPGTARFLRRNIALSGGWLPLTFGCLGLLFAGADAISRRSITLRSGLFMLILISILFLPKRGGLIERQWFAVPGGLVRRRARRKQNGWDVRLFGRRDSVLIVGRLYRASWIIVVADKNGCERTMATRDEVNFLLRAWLSPLEPPRVEQLADLL